jgi:hypothetical protein
VSNELTAPQTSRPRRLSFAAMHNPGYRARWPIDSIRAD